MNNIHTHQQNFQIQLPEVYTPLEQNSETIHGFAVHADWFVIDLTRRLPRSIVAAGIPLGAALGAAFLYGIGAF